MNSNEIKQIKNPNSPEAIQARLNNQPDPTLPVSTEFIFDTKAPYIFIDLTKNDIHQRVNYSLTGGNKMQMNRKLVRISIQLAPDGTMILTNYYVDVRNGQWVIIKTNYDKKPPQGSFPAYFTSAPGTTWINQGKSVDQLHKDQKRLNQTTKIDPNADLTQEQPNDSYYEDFTGTH